MLRRFALAVLTCVLVAPAARPGARPDLLLWPEPQQVKQLDGTFRLNEAVPILLPTVASETDVLLARRLSAELADWYGLALRRSRVGSLPARGPFLLLGTAENQLVQAYLRQKGLEESVADLPAEGYLLRISPDAVLVAGVDAPGAFHGLQTLRQILWTLEKGAELPGVEIRDWPALPFRGIRLYVPGRENLAFFRRFLADFMALFKYNRVIMEVNACMRMDRHPELNAGWREFAADLHYTRRSRPEGPHGEFQDSAHHDAGDGGVLEKNEIRQIVDWAGRNYLEVIPEIPSLTHAYYLLTRHRELAEVQQAEWPDTYCPSRQGSYGLLFDVLDEYVDVIRPKMVHIGHDEWRMPVDACPLCRDKDHGELFARDVRRIYDHLKAKGVGLALWGDHLLETVRGKGYRERKTRSGHRYRIPGALKPEQVRDLIPKDILVFNWFWGDPHNDSLVQAFGFRQVYGNMRPNISGWERRRTLPSVLGGAPSSWAATTEFNIGKDLLYDFIGCAQLLWNGKSVDRAKLGETVRSLLPHVRRYLRGSKLPSEDGNVVEPIDLSAYCNAGPRVAALGLDLSSLRAGEMALGGRRFLLPEGGRAIVVATDPDSAPGLPQVAAGPAIRQDASSLIFLHACARPGRNDKAHRIIYDFHDTAELLGWYEVAYEDGYVETVPVRYGVNILEWDLRSREALKTWPEGRTGSPQGHYAYCADAVECSSRPDQVSITLFAFEWRNPRPGRKIERVRLHAARGFRDYRGRPTRPNGIVWVALSAVPPREVGTVRARASGSPQ